MKLKSLSIFAVLPFLIGCGYAKLDLEIADIQQLEVSNIDADIFLSFVESEKDFIILVSLQSCLECAEVRTILNSYIADRHITIYEINQREYTLIAEEKFYYPLSHYPTLLFLDDGRVIDEKQNNLTVKSEVYKSIDRRLV